MLKNYIKETKQLNKIDLSEVDGLKLYYSKTKSILSVVLFGLGIANCIALIVLNTDNNPKVVIWFLMLFLFLYAMQKAISRVFHKNPVLILSEDKLYYINTQRWYNLSDYYFKDQHLGSMNWSLTFCMEDKTQQRTFEINNWYLKDSEFFKSNLKHRQTMILRAKHK